jgi:hypothetical protein
MSYYCQLLWDFLIKIGIFFAKSRRGDRMSEHQSYVRIMSDIFDSGVWAKLSPAARALYPVLLRFSDYNFKHVWPNTETLQRLTGFRTKKSIVEGKRDLENHGLIHTVSGTGRTSTRFYFRFDYKGSKIGPLGDTRIPSWGESEEFSGEYGTGFEGSKKGDPNHINITIHNNQTNKTKDSLDGENLSEKTHQRQNASPILIENLLEDFGPDVFHYAYQEAKKRNLQDNLPYLRSICRNRVGFLQEKIKNEQKSANQPSHQPSWYGFLEWAKTRLSNSSYKDLQNLEVTVEGECIYLLDEVSPSQKTIVERYFSKEVDTDILVVFASPKVENRIF